MLCSRSASGTSSGRPYSEAQQPLISGDRPLARKQVAINLGGARADPVGCRKISVEIAAHPWTLEGKLLAFGQDAVKFSRRTFWLIFSALLSREAAFRLSPRQYSIGPQVVECSVRWSYCLRDKAYW